MEKIVRILIFIVFLFFEKNVNSKSPPPGTGTSDIPANIMIMLDNSGSMAWSTDANAIGTMQSPIDIATDSSGNIYVLEFNPYCTIKVFNSSGAYLRTIGSGCYDSYTGTSLYFPYQLAIYGNEIYVAHNRGVKVFNLNGNYLRSSDQSRGATAVAVTSNYIYTSPNFASTYIYQFNRSTATYIRSYYLEPYITVTNCPAVTG